MIATAKQLEEAISVRTPHVPRSSSLPRGRLKPVTNRFSYTPTGVELGRGASFVVYEAKRDDGRSFAVKMPLPSKPEASERLVVEASILRACGNNPYIPRFEAYKKGALVMERLDPAHVHPKAGDLTTPDIVNILYGVSFASCTVHEKTRRFHGDIKPGNIAHSPSGLVRLFDFDASLPIGIVDGGIRGSGGFTAPEWILDPDGGKGAAVDVYMLGATIYLLQHGGFLFPLKRGKNPVEKYVHLGRDLRANRRRPWREPETGLEEGLRDLVSKMTKIYAHERPTMREVMDIAYLLSISDVQEIRRPRC